MKFIGRFMIRIQPNMIFLYTTAPSFQFLECHRPRDYIPTCEVLGGWGVSFIKTFSLLLIQFFTFKFFRNPPSPLHPSVIKQPLPYIPGGWNYINSISSNSNLTIVTASLPSPVQVWALEQLQYALPYIPIAKIVLLVLILWIEPSENDRQMQLI